MRSSCLPPVQPHIAAEHEKHPRFRQYLAYRAAMSRQLVAASPFPTWLDSVEREENGFVTVFEVTSPSAALKRGWYKHIFGPNHKLLRRHGPFGDRVAAEGATEGQPVSLPA